VIYRRAEFCGVAEAGEGDGAAGYAHQDIRLTCAGANITETAAHGSTARGSAPDQTRDVLMRIPLQRHLPHPPQQLHKTRLSR